MVPGIPLLVILQHNIDGGISPDPFLKVSKWIQFGGCGDLCVELDSIVTFDTAPECIKLAFGDFHPVVDGPSLGCAEGTIDPDHLEQVSKAKGKWSDKTICVHKSEGVTVGLAKDEEVKHLRDPCPVQCLG